MRGSVRNWGSGNSVRSVRSSPGLSGTENSQKPRESCATGRAPSVHSGREAQPAEVALPLITELGKLAFDFQEQAELSALYATTQTHAAIQGVLAQMTEAAQPFGKYPDPEDPTAVTTQQVQALHRTSMAGMERVYDLLARDLREMLDLQRLDEHESLLNSK